jgi:hypothetical protein
VSDIDGKRVTIEGTITASSLELTDGEWRLVVDEISDLRVVDGPKVTADGDEVFYGKRLVSDPEG